MSRQVLFYTRQHILMRGIPKDFTTTLYRKLYKGTQVIPVPNGKKVKYSEFKIDSKMGNPQCDFLSAL